MNLNLMLEKILTVGGVAGVIAIMIAGTICFRYAAHGAEEIPQILTYSMTTILGFYFGAKAADSTNNEQRRRGR